MEKRLQPIAEGFASWEENVNGIGWVMRKPLLDFEQSSDAVVLDDDRS